MSIHIGDYLKNTPSLGPATWEHHGIYCSLRFLAWNTPQCRLPTDELWIAKHTGCTLEIYREKVLPVLKMQFKNRRGWWYDDELSTLYKRAVAMGLHQSRRAKGRKTKGFDSSPGEAFSLLPSKKQQQHTKPIPFVEKKEKPRRWRSSLLAGE